MSSTAEAEIKPSCRYASALKENNKWVKEPLTERLRTWYDPCSECFPDGKIDIEEVVKKQKRNSNSQTLHRPV